MTDGSARPSRDPVGTALLASAIALLLLVGVSGPSVALPPLGDRGWAPPSLPWHPNGWTVVALQTAAYLLGGLSLWRHVRRPTPLVLRWWHLAGLAGLILLTAPFGTADHTNYAAYGRILIEGGDPWSAVPATWQGGDDPVVSLVQPPWQDTTSVYGPIGTWLMGLAAWLGGDLARQVVWVWQLLVVAAWLATRALLVRLGGDRPTVDRWWTSNVLVLGAGVLGAHVDMLAMAAVAAALALGVARRPLLAGLATGVAASTKLTAGVIGVALLWAALTEGEGSSSRPARAARLVGGTLLVLVPTHAFIGTHALSRISGAGSGISYAMPWRAVYTALDPLLGEATARTLVTWLAAAACVLIAVVLWRITQGLTGLVVVRGLFVLSTAYALGAGYVLPWYELPQWLATAALVAVLSPAGWRRLAPLLALIVARSTVLALAYVPGRVRLPADIELVTLGFRFVASPLATVTVWAVLWLLWRRARHRPAHPPGSGSAGSGVVSGLGPA